MCYYYKSLANCSACFLASSNMIFWAWLLSHSALVSAEFWITSRSQWIKPYSILFFSPLWCVLDSVVKVSFRGSIVTVKFVLYKATSNKRCIVSCTCLVHCHALQIAITSPCPSSLFRILRPVWVNEVHDPGFLHRQTLTSFLHSWGGEAGTQMESTLSRRFSNYTLETNQPEHCFLINRTKQ